MAKPEAVFIYTGQRAAKCRIERRQMLAAGALGPVAGALIAVGFAYVLRGSGGDVISRAAGSGVLDEGVTDAQRPGQ